MATAQAAQGEVVDLAEGGEKLRTLVKTDAFKTVRISLQAGDRLAPHKAEGPITVQCLAGNAVFTSEDQPRELTAGSWLHLTADTMHSVEAHTDSVLLVTIIHS